MRNWNFHILNRLSFYYCAYLSHDKVTEEYWLGHRRKRIARIGKFTVWVRK